MDPIWIAVIVVAVLAVVLVALYNALATTRVRVDEAWSDITVQLKRRLDLIPNLVNTVKGYAKHEKEVFEKVTEARSNAMNAQGVAETAKAEGEFEQALKSLFAVAENYPQLRASENFQQLQTELTDTEDKIMASRRFYNAAAREFNVKIATFPSNMVAKMFGFKKREFYEVEDRANLEKAAEVKF